MQEINFPQATDTLQSSDIYAPLHNASLPAYTLTEADLSSISFAPNLSPLVTSVIDQGAHTQTPVVKPTTTQSTTARTPARSKTGKTKFNQREYDPNKHCGVVTAENPKPCTRSLTCKAHALSLRRTVEGRAKPFDTLLAEHRASRDVGATAAALAAAAPSTPLHASAHPPAAAPHNLPPMLVNNSTLDLNAFNSLTAEQQVNDIYASLLSVEDGDSMLPDTASITSLLSQPLPADAFLLPDDAELPSEVPLLSLTSPAVRPDPPPDEGPPALIPTDVCWYASCPRPLAVCTFNASHAGSAITLGKKFATVRSNIKSSLTRSQCKSSGAAGASGANDYYYNQNALSKSVHWNTSKSTKPEVRKLIVTCSRVTGSGVGVGVGSGSGSGSGKEAVRQTLSELFASGEVRHTLNGHTLAAERKRGPLKPSKRAGPAVLDLGFSLDATLLADEKC